MLVVEDFDQAVRLLQSDGTPFREGEVKLIVDERPALDPATAERKEVTGRTDGDGIVHVHLPSGSRGVVSIWAMTSGGWQLAMASEDYWSPLHKVITITMGELKYQFRFEVNDPSGKPLRDASIRFMATSNGAPIDLAPTLMTDEGGKAIWSGVVYGDWWAAVSKPGFAPVRTCPYQFVADLDEERFYRVTLVPERTVTGRVCGEDGKAVPWAIVNVGWENDDLPTFTGFCVVANEEGLFRVQIPVDRVAVFTLPNEDDHWAVTDVELSRRETEIMLVRRPADRAIDD